jgi:hypothetical protein
MITIIVTAETRQHSRMHSLDLPCLRGWTPQRLSENSNQIFPKNKLRGLSPNFHIHVSVSDLYIPTVGLSILLQENTVCGPILGIYKSLTDT